MNFYTGLIIVSVILIMLYLIWVFVKKKNSTGLVKSMEGKKQELLGIIDDAEQMIEELNRFSDYIVTQMDLKNEELKANIKSAEDEITRLEGKAKVLYETINEAKASMKEIGSAAPKKQFAVNGIRADYVSPEPKLFKYNSDLIIDCMEFDNGNYKPVVQNKPPVCKVEKVIPINSRYKEVIRMAEDGMNDVEIAKKLDIGKGEIELILGLNKN